MRFTITYVPHGLGFGYKVDIPNYPGGEVVTIDEYDRVVAERDALEADLDELYNRAL